MGSCFPFPFSFLKYGTKRLEFSRIFWKAQGIIFIYIVVENRETAEIRITDLRETEGLFRAEYSSEILVDLSSSSRNPPCIIR